MCFNNFEGYQKYIYIVKSKVIYSHFALVAQFASQDAMVVISLLYILPGKFVPIKQI